MEFSHYFKPLSIDAELAGGLADCITDYNDSLDCADFDIALIFATENRWTDDESGGGDEAFVKILGELTRLHVHGYLPKVLNLGQFLNGNEVADTEAGLAELIDYLMVRKVLPVIIGGGRSLTYAAYKAFSRNDLIVNITSVDNHLNIDESRNENYIGRIIKEQPNYLFNYSNIAYQSYFVSPAELELSDSLFFDSYRLGTVRGDVFSVEPVIRSSEIATVSLDVIKYSDFTSSLEPQPNGLYAEEICQVCRYIGLAEKSKVVLFTELNLKELTVVDARLLAEMLWCVIDGYYSRKSEIPGGQKDGFLKYRVPLKNDEFHLIFYKSISTDRWWMEVPVPPQYANKYRKHHLVPCSYEDYLVATRDDLPERWWKAYKKML